MPQSRKVALAKVLESVTQTPSGCWVPPFGENGQGYRKVRADGRKVFVHRLVYEEQVGPVPDGLELDHLCRNRACCNPAHLEPVTGQENTLRGETVAAHNKAKTHCKQGHPLSGDNLRMYTTPNGKPARQCKTCVLASVARHRAGIPGRRYQRREVPVSTTTDAHDGNVV